jgi:hypothetical protein
MEESDLLEAVRLHIQAQEEIKQELLSTVRLLERESRPPRTTLKQVHFHTSTLRHIVSDQSAVVDQIIKFNSSVLPDLQQQLNLITQKADALNSRIEILQKPRKTSILANLDDPEKVHQSIAALSESLRNEIQNLTEEEEKVRKETAIARVELRALQDQFLNRQREKTRQTIEAEVIDEQKFFEQRGERRRRSSTMVGMAVAPPDRRGSLRVTRRSSE